MKKIKILFTGLALVIGIFISCDESEIELVNPNQLSAETFFKSSAQLESAVTAAYTYLQEVGNYARYQYYINDNIAGENYAAGNLEADKVQMINRDVDEANNGNNQYWQHNYQGIGRCNFVIVNEENFENIPDTEIAARLGEVRFIRALCYFNLVAKYGEIPLVLDLETVQGGRPKSSVAEVYNAIITDLQFAAANLPNKEAQEVGRATSGAAWALLGKVLLQNGDAGGAKTALSNVTGYSLIDNYRDNFTVAGEHNEESIFEVMYDESTGAGDSWNQNGRGNSETTFRAQEYSGWYNVKPSQELLDEYEDGDTRYAANFYSIDDSDNGTMTNTFNNGTSTFTSGTIGPDDNPSWRKYQNLDDRSSETPDSGINARVLRYSDVLLMQAEAEIRSGGPESVALGFLNQVRSRTSVALPDVNVSGTQAILDAIKHERWVELAGEQSRWLDLQRFDGDSYLMPIPNIELQGNTNL
ncbi:RagB/SusD family nutrient uptake outer membrane protein [Hyunsoonleella pacifica]|uniref:RagB/SusD family nutrient uptake outer membrane protein n=1 Tax=Hyunsoonleella pacifica TaxID=1080224 RepID=A0A4Q9FPC8_9FLAO|nr:RagB/SusD family nutrient uptake outer membrane protein [Hyunsoonleella pacifica]TBN16585.1 RagB/SusD family nutrient uptake outer membrane protein [Hyunsoonleella pacifica]GGD18187.1 membrane protein [Hyunsoonleella pacifica]